MALVRVADSFAHEPVYIQRFFKRELGFAETAVVFDIDQLLRFATVTPLAQIDDDAK